MSKMVMVWNTKGGSGKTTIALNLAGFLHDRKIKVGVIDLDEYQETALQVAEHGKLGFQVVKPKNIKELTCCDVIIADYPAGVVGNELFNANNKKEDLLITPCKPSPADFGSLYPHIRDRQNNAMMFIATMVDKRRTLDKGFIDRIEQRFGACHPVGCRAVYVSTMGEGKTIFTGGANSLRGYGLAVLEMKAIGKIVIQKLGIKDLLPISEKKSLGWS